MDLPSVHVDARFPCGHMLHVELRGFLFLPTGVASLPDGACPLHGKDCKPPSMPSFMEVLTGQRPPHVHKIELGKDLKDNQPAP